MSVAESPSQSTSELQSNALSQFSGHTKLTRSRSTGGSASSSDLALITDAPGPPMIQPGIPALQPSIPASGVASLSIPPAHQTSSSKSFGTGGLSSATPIPSLSFATTLGVSSSIPTSSSLAPAVVTPTSWSSSTTTSIPFLSELMSQLFSQPSTSTVSSISGNVSVSSSATSSPSTVGLPSLPETTADYATPPATTVSDPKDGLPSASMNSMLVYSIQLPPYNGGLDTSGVVETMTASSPAEDTTKQPSATVYSYTLPPYTPKVPTYVATSAGLAPVSMTVGAPGNPTGNIPTTRIFLPQGSVDPSKDVPAVATSSIIPLYSPACLGNAYGGGYVITPTLFAANSNVTGIAKIPPAYGFSYKPEPTQSSAYSAAVIIANTEAPRLSGGLPLPSATSDGSVSSAPPGTLAQSMFNLGSMVTGVLSISPAQSVTPNASPFPSMNSSLGLAGLSNATAVLVSQALMTSTYSRGLSSGATQSIVDVANSSCTTITTSTTLSYVVNAAGSVLATLGPQDQLQRAAVHIDSTIAGISNSPSTTPFSAELNDTPALPASRAGMTAFGGISSKLIVSSILTVIVYLGF